jgi:hypothetical protein
MVGQRRVALGTVLVALLSVAGALPAGAATRVGHKQYFTGVINGTNGNTVTPIDIQVACSGPAGSGQTGHPLSGQTLAVHQMFPPSSDGGSLGYTGHDVKIEVFFNAVPPARPKARAAAGSVVFTRYDKPQALPTSVTLPCTGTGTVWFTPIAVVPPSRSESVPVEFVSPPGSSARRH